MEKLPDKTASDLEHCYEMIAFAESHPEPGNPLVDIGWLDWSTETFLIQREEVQWQDHG